METENTLRIVYLEAENVKRLRAVRIRPDKTLVRIEGRNAQGKSSVLDAIAAALGGGKWNPELPVRKGEKKASVKLDLGEIVVERRWTASGGTTLEVTNADGAPQRSPQAILDKLVGDLTFDPLAFTRMKPREQGELLKRLAGLDFSDLELERSKLYDGRAVANRIAKEAEARVGQYPANVPSEPVDISALIAQQKEIAEHNRNVERAQDAYRLAMMDVTSRESRVSAARFTLNQAQSALGVEESGLKGAIAISESKKEQADSLSPKDAGDLTTMIADAEHTNNAIRSASEWKTRNEDAKRKATAASDLDDKITAIDDDKERKLMAAKFPLEGLSVDANGPTLNGIPFSQASASEQLRTSVAIGLSGKPRARIMLIRDGSLLDSASLEDLHRVAVEFDAQCFVERVADTKSPAAVYIEDGEVSENETEPTT